MAVLFAFRCVKELGILTLDFVTGLSGGHIRDFKGGQASNSVPDQAEALLVGISVQSAVSQIRDTRITISEEKGALKVTASGIGGHAAFPKDTVNAIGILAGALQQLRELTAEEKRIMHFLSEILGDCEGHSLGIAAEDEKWGKNTVVGGCVSVKDGRLIQNMNIRYIGTVLYDVMFEKLRKAAERKGFWTENVNNSAPLYVPLDSMNGLPKKLTELAGRLLGQNTLKPVILAGGTHARKLPNAIGFGPDMDMDPPCLGHAHAVDESVRLDIMERAIRVYAAAKIAIDEILD